MSNPVSLTDERLNELANLTYIEDLTSGDWDEYYELIRMARLGLWARDHGIPTLMHYATDGVVSSKVSGHGDSSDCLEFYYGLKFKPVDVLEKLPDFPKDLLKKIKDSYGVNQGTPKRK